MRGHTGEPRKINVERRSMTNFAVGVHPAFMLLNDAENGGQTEAGAFAGILGGEEGFKDARKNFRRDATAGVAHAQTHERTGPGLS